MKLMAIDYGVKRVGIASTDDSGKFALPRMVFDNDEALLDKIIKFKNENNIDQVIIGESKSFSGEANSIQESIEKFRQDLLKLGVETVSHSEILTTVEARRLQGNTQMTDASAAALILKSFLDKVYNKDA